MVSWKTVSEILTNLSIAGGLGLGGLFAALFLLAGVTYSHTGDSVCNQLECSAYIEVNTSYWEICFAGYDGTKYEDETLFKKRTRSRTLHVNLDKVDSVIKTEPEIPVDWYVATKKRYADHKDEKGYWRHVKDGDCWKRSSKPNRNKLVGRPSKGQVTKWSFGLDGYIDIDPMWISWDYIYKNKTEVKGIYKDVKKVKLIPQYEIATLTIKPVYVKENKSWTKPYSYDFRNLTGYKEEIYYESEFVGYKNVSIRTDERIGLKVGDKKYGLDTNVVGDNLIQWSIPIGDRNFEEYGSCRDYEKNKGICYEKNLLGVIK